MYSRFIKKPRVGGGRGKYFKPVNAYALPPVLGLNHTVLTYYVAMPHPCVATLHSAVLIFRQFRLCKEINTLDFPEPGREPGEPGLAGAGRDPVELHPGPGDGGQQPRAPALPVRRGHGTDCRLPSVLPQPNQGSLLILVIWK